MEGTMNRLRNENGIAMVTVLFVAAVLTVVASTAAFVTVREFRAQNDDRRGSQALSFAEAGIDRMILEIQGTTWQVIAGSGCSGRPQFSTGADEDAGGSLLPDTGGDIASRGVYRAELSVFNPSTQCTTPLPRPRGTHQFIITGIGEQPTAKRVVRQVIDIAPKPLPIGLYARTGVQINGSGQLRRTNLISEGDIVGRDKIAFTGNDPWYDRSDFYPCENPTVPGNPVGCFPDDGNPNDTGDMPASAHAAGRIFCQNKCPNRNSTLEEHSVAFSPNCEANGNAGTEGQSGWDGSNWTTNSADAVVTDADVCTGQAANGHPPTSLFTLADARRLAPQPELAEEDYAALKSMAQTSGIYCDYATGSRRCTVAGQFNAALSTGALQINGDANNGTGVFANPDLPRDLVTYFDFPRGTDPEQFSDNFVQWKAKMGACNDDPELNRTVVIAIRNGSLQFGSGATANGALFAEDGMVDSNGSYTFNGTVLANHVEIISGANVTLDDCWVNNPPTVILDITPVSWSEIDR
jgi:hypothetical protein